MNKLASIALLIGLSACSTLESTLDSATSIFDDEPEVQEVAADTTEILFGSSSSKIDYDLANTQNVIPSIENNNAWQAHNINRYYSNLRVNNVTELSESEHFSHDLTITPLVIGGYFYSLDSELNLAKYSKADLDEPIWEQLLIEDNPDGLKPTGLAFANNHVYISFDSGDIYAIDAELGNTTWQKNIGSPVVLPVIASNDKLYIQTIDNQLYAVEPTNGEIAWRHFATLENTSLSLVPAPLIMERLIIAQYSTGEIYGLNLINGKEKWLEQIDKTGKVPDLNALSKFMLTDGVRIFANSNNGKLYGLDADSGNILWQESITLASKPWLAGDYIYLIDNSQNLVAINIAGGIKYITKLPQPLAEDDEQISWDKPLMANGDIITLSKEGYLAVLDAQTGQVKSLQEAESGEYSDYLIVDGNLYTVSNGDLIKLQAEE